MVDEDTGEKRGARRESRYNLLLPGKTRRGAKYTSRQAIRAGSNRDGFQAEEEANRNLITKSS